MLLLLTVGNEELHSWDARRWYNRTTFRES